MSIFRHKIVIEPTEKQVAIHKDANKKTVTNAIEANKRLNRVLVNNGFTVRIAVAAGSKR